MTVRLRKNARKDKGLTGGQLYDVIGIEGDYFRIISDSGLPYLYPPRMFSVVDPRRPDHWIRETGADGEEYAYPREFASPGFFEDFFDRKSKAMATFWRVINDRLAHAG